MGELIAITTHKWEQSKKKNKQLVSVFTENTPIGSYHLIYSCYFHGIPFTVVNKAYYYAPV